MDQGSQNPTKLYFVSLILGGSTAGKKKNSNNCTVFSCGIVILKKSGWTLVQSSLYLTGNCWSHWMVIVVTFISFLQLNFFYYMLRVSIWVCLPWSLEGLGPLETLNTGSITPQRFPHTKKNIVLNQQGLFPLEKATMVKSTLILPCSTPFSGEKSHWVIVWSQSSFYLVLLSASKLWRQNYLSFLAGKIKS